jgi:hypothetical protein
VVGVDAQFLGSLLKEPTKENDSDKGLDDLLVHPNHHPCILKIRPHRSLYGRARKYQELIQNLDENQDE